MSLSGLQAGPILLAEVVCQVLCGNQTLPDLLQLPKTLDTVSLAILVLNEQQLSYSQGKSLPKQ